MFANSAIVALFAGLAAAQLHEPVGEPAGNPITRPLNEVVPACKPFEITWQPTTSNTVSLVLLRGPSTNVVPLMTITEGISNSGSFSWTPASSLEADTSRYGLQLIDDVTGQFQYSTQFGISKDGACDTYSTPVPSSTPYGGGYPISTAAPSASKDSYPVSSIAMNSTLTVSVTSKVSSTVIVGTGTAGANSSAIVMPTKSMSVPESLLPTPTGAEESSTSAPPESTGAASSIQAGLGLVGAAAAFAFML